MSSVLQILFDHRICVLTTQNRQYLCPENWIRQNRQFIIHNSSNLRSRKSAVHDGRLPDEFGRQKGKISEAEFGGGGGQILGRFGIIGRFRRGRGVERRGGGREWRNSARLNSVRSSRVNEFGLG